MKNNTKEQLNRMIYMMNYGNVKEENKPYSTVEYTHIGADGKMYGLVREGTKYYIKSSEKKDSNEYLKEDFNYIGGFANKFRHEYSSFNNGLKQMDMFLRELNEECGKTAGTIETWSNEKNSYISTPMSESMKKEISRQKQIMENAGNIRKVGNINEDVTTFEKNNIKNVPNEAPKTGTTEEGEVFTDKVVEPKDTLGVNSNKDYTKKPNANGNEAGDSTPFTEKAKKMNCNENENTPFDDEVCPKCGKKNCTCESEEKDLSEDFKIDDTQDDDLVNDNEPDEAPFTDAEIDDIDSTDNAEESEPEEFTSTDDDDKMSKIESLLQQVVDKLDAIESAANHESSEEELYGDEDTEDDDTTDDDADFGDSADTDNDEPFKESVDAKSVLEARLNDFGKHPRYQKEPIDGITMSDDKKEGQYDMADDSVKSDKPYGTEIGDGNPYTINPKLLRDSIAEAVTKVLKKKLQKGK